MRSSTATVFCATALAFAGLARAQTGPQRARLTTIVGCVVDSATGAPLENLNISALVTGLRADADSAGYFLLRVTDRDSTLTAFRGTHRPRRVDPQVIALPRTGDTLVNLGVVRIRTSGPEAIAMPSERLALLHADCQFALQLATGAVALGPALPSAAADNALFAFLRGLIDNSLTSGGTRPDARFVATDPSTRRVLRSAGIAFDTLGARDIVCPASTAFAGAAVQPRFGYVVRSFLQLTRDRAGWVFGVGKHCDFNPYDEVLSAFYESAVWEIRRVNGVWRIIRTLASEIT